MTRVAVLMVVSTLALAACEQANTTPPAAQAAPAPPQPQQQAVAPEAPLPAPGQNWHVLTFRCNQMIGLSDDDRAAAAMFYYGYLAARAHFVVLDASKIEGNVRRVMDRCATTPNITVVEAFRQELGGKRVKANAE